MFHLYLYYISFINLRKGGVTGAKTPSNFHFLV